MASVQHLQGVTSTAVGASLTRYLNAFTGCDPDATENNVRTKLGAAAAGTISLFGAYVSANDHTANSTMRVRKNAGNGNGVLTITATTTNTQWEDTSNSDAVVDDDQIAYSLVTGSGGTGLTVESTWHTFAPTSGTVAVISQEHFLTYSGTSDLYTTLGGQATLSTTLANMEMTIRVGGTFSNAQVQHGNNSRSDQTDMRLAINGVAGNLVVVYAAAATGQLEDVTNSDAVVADDEVAWLWDQNGGTGSLANQHVLKVEFTASSTAYPLLAGGSGTNQAFGTTHYHPVSGRLKYGETTEADSQVKANAAFTWEKLRGYISTYTISGGNYVVRASKNGSLANQTATWTAANTAQEDTSNTDAVADEDEIAWSSVTTGASGNAALRTLASLATVASSGVTLTPGLGSQPYTGRTLSMGFGIDMPDVP